MSLEKIRFNREGLLEELNASRETVFGAFVPEIQTSLKGVVGLWARDELSFKTRRLTEQHALENRLRRGREYLDAFVHANIVGVFYANLEGKIFEANHLIVRDNSRPLDGVSQLANIARPVIAEQKSESLFRYPSNRNLF